MHPEFRKYLDERDADKCEALNMLDNLINQLETERLVKELTTKLVAEYGRNRASA